MKTTNLAAKANHLRLATVVFLVAAIIALTLAFSGSVPAAEAQTPSTDTDLTSITVNGNTVPGFDADTSSVHYGVAHNIEQVTIAGTPEDATATVSYGGTDADDTLAGFQKDLRAGGNRVTITVTAEDTTTTESWNIHVNRGVATLRGWKASEDFDTLKAAGNENPSLIWSNGATMWVADDADDKIYAYDMATKARDADKDFDALADDGIDSLAGIWSDGTTMWVVDRTGDKLYAYTLTTKVRDAGKDFDTLDADNDAPYGMWSNGATMWVTDSSDDKLYAYDMNTKARDAGKDFDTLSDAGLVSPLGIWSDGATMWVSLWRNNKLFAFNLSTKARDASKDFDTLLTAGSNLPTVIWSDGTTMWTVDVFNKKIYSYVHRVLGSDTTLSAISVDGTDLTPFDSDSASHRHFVESDVTEITVAATATDDASSVEITSPADADDATDGHQVSIGEGTTTVTFTVTAEDGTSQEQTLSIIKPSTAYFDWKQSEDFDTLADAGNEYPQGIWSDGTTMWVADLQDGARSTPTFFPANCAIPPETSTVSFWRATHLPATSGPTAKPCEYRTALTSSFTPTTWQAS